jgi:hypothetical protein
MRDALKWVKGAIAARDLDPSRTFYKMDNSEIKATNGRLIAGHPCDTGCDFLVPGEEFEKVLDRLPGDITIKPLENAVRFRSGHFSGTINTLPLDRWSYPDVSDTTWKPIPAGLVDLLRDLRPFVSDNQTQPWSTCVALENGWGYATNNVALAGKECKGIDMMALLPAWAVDFVLSHATGLKSWAWSSNYVAFQWENEAWMRSNLVIGQFPEAAAAMIRKVRETECSTKITDEFRQAFVEVAAMAEDTILLYADRIVSRFKQAEIVANIKCKTPKEAECSIWGASYLVPAIKAADTWSPELWGMQDERGRLKPSPWKGNGICGLVMGRRA